MKEIYIVTSGCYSDYGIDEVFSSKDTAEEYVRLQNGKNKDDGYGYRVETYTVDNVEFDSIEVVDIVAKKYLQNKDNYEFEIETFETLKNSVNKRVMIDIHDYGNKYSTIRFTRPVNNRSEKTLESTYRKVVQDYFFMVESNWEYYKEYKNKYDLSDQLNNAIE